MIITIKHFQVEAIIGILEHERTAKQRIIVDSKIWYDSNHVSLIHGFLDYVSVLQHIQILLCEKHYTVLECALQDIAYQSFLSFPSITKITLKIQKPDIYKNCLIGVKQTFKRDEIL